MTRRIELFTVAPAALALVAWLGCGSRDPVPAGPHHPADPSAAAAPATPAPTPAEGEHATAGAGHHHHASDDDHAAHGGEHAPDATPAHGPDALMAAEKSAYRVAAPVFEKHCASCHGPSAKPSKETKKALRHFSMGEYPFGGHHAGELGATIRKVLGAEGGKATMPEDDPGAVKGDELELVLAWTRAYDAAAKAGAGYHGEAKGHDHDAHGDDHHDHDHGGGHDHHDH